jgi:hypothetical protein
MSPASAVLHDSMVIQEINALLKAWADGKKMKGRVWDFYSSEVIKFNYSLQYRDKGTPNEAKDKGKLILPKMFRRYCVYSIYRKAGINTGRFNSFKEYLKSQDNVDKLILLKDFSSYIKNKNKALLKPLSQYFENNKFKKLPDEIVFTENDSTLVDKFGKEITGWS